MKIVVIDLGETHVFISIIVPTNVQLGFSFGLLRNSESSDEVTLEERENLSSLDKLWSRRDWGTIQLGTDSLGMNL
jgi:hypothetical protein